MRYHTKTLRDIVVWNIISIFAVDFAGTEALAKSSVMAN